MSDVWANRPPAEGIVDHLDEFFPNVNLDQPVIEDEGYASSPPMSPVREGGVGLGKKSSHEFGGAGAASGSSRSVTPSIGQSGSSEEENDTLGSDQSTLKATTREAIASVAQRNIRKAGGLNRTRSIREVVQSNYQQPHWPDTAGCARRRHGTGTNADDQASRGRGWHCEEKEHEDVWSED